MKKIVILICFFSFCTSFSQAITNESLKLIVNSELIDENFSALKYKNHILIPIQKFFDSINLEYTTNTPSSETIELEFENTKLKLHSNSYNSTINGQNVNLIVPTITQNNQFYISINLINDLTKYQIQYESICNSLFVTSKNNLRKMNFFFNKVENILKNYSIIKMDIINEITTPDNSTYSIGNNICINKITNKIFQKNMIEDNWEETNIQISNNTSTKFNNVFFTGISVDRLNSNNNYIIFNGYYPLDNNRLCYSTLYINPHTLEIEKQINTFEFEGASVKQTVFYYYN